MSLGLAPLSLLTRAGLSGALVVLLGALLWYRARQARGAIGGALSGPKAAWLLWAIYTWFFAAPLLGLDPACPSPWREVLLVGAANMWARGLVELYMLHVSKNWRPPYGIAHDVFSLALALATWALAPSDDAALATLWGLAFGLCCLVIAASYAVETYYAVRFHDLVEGRTTGDDGVWFASAEDPRFARINRVTFAVNLPLYTWALLVNAAAWGVFS